MEEFRLVVWGMHGIYGAGKTMDETFGLIETVEKAAQIYMLTAHLPRINTIKDKEMMEEVLKHLRTMRSTWEEVMKGAKQKDRA